MSTVEAIYTGGVFKPLDQVDIAENQRVRLTIDLSQPLDTPNWLSAVEQFQRQIVARHGVLPDSTPDIAADRLRHE